MFGFSIVKPPFSFTDVKTIAIPTICSVCRAHTKRQVIIKMNKFNMFITAVCVLFLINSSNDLHACLRKKQVKVIFIFKVEASCCSALQGVKYVFVCNP